MPGVVNLRRLRPNSEMSIEYLRNKKAYSVRRSFATCGVIVMVLVPFETDTGGGRRNDKYQYIVSSIEVIDTIGTSCRNDFQTFDFQFGTPQLTIYSMITFRSYVCMYALYIGQWA